MDQRFPDAARDDLPRRRRVIGGVVLLVVLAGGILVAGIGSDPGPQDWAHRYLTAARNGDVATALDLAGVGRGDAESDQFLTGTAGAGDWSVSSVTLLSSHEIYDHGPDFDIDDPAILEKADVEYVVDIPGFSTVTGELSLSRPVGDSDWRIDNPLIELVLPYTALWYLDLNGMVAPQPPPTDGEGVSYRVLPGVYRLYQDAPDVVAVDDTPVPVFPGASLPDGTSVGDRLDVDPPGIALTEVGEQAADEAVHALIDRCAQGTDLELQGCPFGADPVIGPEIDGDYYNDLYDIGWEITEEPRLAFVVDDTGVQVTDRVRGVATVTVTGYESVSTGDGLARGDRHTGSAACEIRTSDLEIGIDSDGGMRVVPQNYRFQEWPGDHYWPGDGDTCR